MASALSDFGVQHLAKGVSRLSNLVLSKGEGSFVTAEGGRKFLDLTCGIGVTNLGHCHPKVTQAAQEQCAKFVHSQVNIGLNEPMVHLVKKLLPVMPDKSLDTFFFSNSGSEAVESAVKLARHATKKQNVIVMQGAFHGRTFGAMAMTKSKTVYSANSAPLMPGVFTTPFPYWHQSGFPSDTPSETLVEHSLYQLDLILQQQTTPGDTAAIIIEPVLGEGGYVPAPQAFMEGLRERCDEHNILLIIDEVQSGFGRTGKYFAIEHYDGIVPDIMVMAKGIANGFPLSGIVSRKELFDQQIVGSMGGTYAGNAVACAAAIACADVMKSENILENVNARSKQLFLALESLKQDPVYGTYIKDVRGFGLMVGFEFAGNSPYGKTKGKTTTPEKLASRVQAKCYEKGLLILTTSVYETIRFIPPLTISEQELKEGIDIFTQSVKEVLDSLQYFAQRIGVL